MRLSIQEASRFETDTPFNLWETYIYGVEDGLDGIREGDTLVEYKDLNNERSYPVKHVMRYPYRNDAAPVLRVVVERLENV